MSDLELKALTRAEHSGTRYARVLSLAGSVSLMWCLMTPLVVVGIHLREQTSAPHSWLLGVLGVLNACGSLWLWNQEVRRFHAATRLGVPPPHGHRREVLLMLGQLALTLVWMVLSYQHGHFLARVCYWLPMVMLAVTMLPRWGFIGVVMGGIVTHYVLEYLLHESSFYPNVFLAMMMIGLTAIWALVLESSKRWHCRVRKAVDELETARQEVERQSEEIAMLSALHERHRLAREVHDVVGNSLTVIAVQLEVVALCLPTRPQEALDALQKARDTAQEGLAQMRLTVSSIVHGLPDGLCLVEAVEHLVERLRRPGFDVQVRVIGTPVRLNAELENTLYRCAQEALTNVIKHSGSAQARLTLDFETPGSVGLTISDCGRGLPKPLPEGCGLNGIRERVRDLKGELTLTNGPEGGALLQFRFDSNDAL